jgi:hypothetical protein
MNQLAIAVKESLEILTVDSHTESNSNKKVQPSIQNSYIDSVEFSDRAIALSMGAVTETNSETDSNTDTDQGHKENPGTNQQQQEPAFSGTVSLNVLA